MNLYFFPFVKEQPIPSAQGRSQDTTGAFASDFFLEYGGGERDRTDDPLLAKQVLSQLSYTPVWRGGPEPAARLGGSGWTRTIDPRLIKTVL